MKYLAPILLILLMASCGTKKVEVQEPQLTVEILGCECLKDTETQ